MNNAPQSQHASSPTPSTAPTKTNVSTRYWWISGTDTDAGKTLVASALLHKHSQHGHTALGIKPIAAGCLWRENGPQGGEWQNDDALSLQRYSHPAQAYGVHNPIALPDAVAPHIAATRSGYRLSLDEVQRKVLDACQITTASDAGSQHKSAPPYDAVVIEGAGGWYVPLNDQHTLADVAHGIDQVHALNVVLVIGMKLGCINHALLSARAIQASGLTLSGWVANHIDPHMAEPEENVRYLTAQFHRWQVPCFGVIPHMAEENGRVARAAHCLQWPTI